MECQSSDSKKVLKVFDASKRKSTRKKEGLDDTNSHATDDSVSICQPNACRPCSRKSSRQNIATTEIYELQEHSLTKREREISPAMSRSPDDGHRHTHSPRRHRRGRKGLSLALKAGLASTPRSDSPNQDRDTETIPPDQDSFIYAFLEETIKRDKKKHRHSHSHRREERRRSRERDASAPREHRHYRRKSHVSSRDREKPSKDSPVAPIIDQAILFETFAKICSQLNEKASAYTKSYQQQETMARSTSHKSLQCEVTSKHKSYDVDCQPVRLRSHEQSREAIPNRIRSQESFSGPRAREKISDIDRNPQEKCMCCYDKEPRYKSKADMARSKMDNQYREYPPINVQTRCCIDTFKNRPLDAQEYRDYDKNPSNRYYEDDKRKCVEQKTSRSFDMRPEPYTEEDRCCRRTVRSENNKERRYDERDKRYDEKYYEAKPTESRLRDRIKEPRGDRRWKRNLERFERNSVASREDDYRDRERDRYSERERDSGLSVADGETSTVSGRSNCLKVVKQEIAEQREAMDKMMKLWKELMRCFKGIPQTHVQQNKAAHVLQDSAANVRDSAAAQMRLWQECMRRYETVARDVGDTDARLMEEIKKQRCEMAEMANMWQECLQRYRDMSNDFNNLKQKLATSETPTHDVKPCTAPLVCAEVDGSVPPPHYRLPPNYPPQVRMPAGYGAPGSPLRTRASAPPAWWWCDPARSPRRRSSPESRASRERDRDHRHRPKEDTRGYKQKHSKPSAARSEHRHRKR